MTDNGMTYPVLTFDQIIDTEFGLLDVIYEKYNDRNTFYWALLEAPPKVKLGLLYNRLRPNPITVVAKDKDNKELMDDYYKQFMEEEYVAILKKSIVTGLYKLLQEFMAQDFISPTIICNSQIEATYLGKINPEIPSKCSIIVDDKGFKNIIKDEKYTSIYVKNIRDTIPIINNLETRNIFVSGYRYNFEDDDRNHLINEYQVLLSSIAKVHVYSMYSKDDIIEGV